MTLSPASRHTCRRIAAAACMLLASSVALAHPGHVTVSSGSMLAVGLLHPLTGIDHLLAMLAVGLWAATSPISRRMPWAAPAIVGVFAVFHGMAHGVEMAPGASILPYVAGLMASTLALILTGWGIGRLVKDRALWLPRLAGAGIAAYGFALWSVAA